MSGRVRAVASVPRPPMPYQPPQLGGEPSTPKPVVTTRTAAPQLQEISISGARGLVALPYGRQRIVCGADSVLYTFKPGPPNYVPDDFWYVVAVGEGEVEGVVSIKTPRGPLVEDEYGWVGGGIRVWFYRGTAAQTYDPNLGAVDWTWRENLPGIVYAVVHLFGISNFWQELPTLEFVIDGLRCLDPRSGQTVYTTNTVLQLYDFLRRSSGKALPSWMVNTDSIITAANIADELMAGGTRRYTSHVLVRDATDVDDWIKVFRLLCDGWFTYRGGQFHLILDRPTAVTAAYTDAQLALDTEPEFERADPHAKVDHVRVSWTNTATWAEEWEEEFASAAVESGLEERVTATYKLPWIQDRSRARRLAIYLLNSFTFDSRVRMRWSGATIATAAGDVVTQSISSLGFGAQPWRVWTRQYHSDSTYTVDLAEYNTAKYSDAVVPASASKIESTFPDPLTDPLPLISADIDEEQYEEQIGYVKSRARITFTREADPFFEAVELYLRIGSGEQRLVDEFTQSPAVYPFSTLAEGTEYHFELRVRNRYGRRSTPLAVDFTPQGKSWPPSDVPYIRGASDRDGKVQLKWQRAIDLDLVGYEVRRLYGVWTASAWNLAAPIDKTDALTLTDSPALGTYTYLIKAYDSGRNYSANAAVCVVEATAAGSLSEFAEGLPFYNQVEGPDYAAGSGNFLAEGVNSGKLQYLLCRSDTWDDIAAHMAGSGLATLDDYDAHRSGAELCFPLPPNASGTGISTGAATGGTSTRNWEYWVRVSGQQRIGRNTNTAAHAIAEPVVSNGLAGEHFISGASGMALRLGLRLSTNDPWSQVIVTPDGAGNVFYIARRRIVVPLGVYSATTGADGRATVVLPPDKQLGSSQEFEVIPIPTYGSSVNVIPESQSNTSFTVRAYDASGAPAAGVPVRVIVEDHGRGGNVAISTP